MALLGGGSMVNVAASAARRFRWQAAALMCVAASPLLGVHHARAAPDGPGWTAVAAPAFAGVNVTDIESAPEGFVAIGYGSTGWVALLGDRAATSWERHPMPQAGCKAAPLDVAASPRGFVAVGSILEGACDVGGSWWSADGRQWKESEVGDLGMQSDVVWSGEDFLAVGGRMIAGTPVAATWSSRDGQTWVSDPSSDDTRPFLTSLVVTPDGVFATGLPNSARPHPPLIASRTPDGWEATVLGDLGGWDQGLLAAMPGRLIAMVGRCPDETCVLKAIWTSPDGRKWERADARLPDDALPYRLLGYPGGVIGRMVVDDQLEWHSADGLQWRTRHAPGPTEVIAYGHGTLVGAATASEWGRVWVARVGGPMTDTQVPLEEPVTQWPIPVIAGLGAAWLAARRFGARPRYASTPDVPGDGRFVVETCAPTRVWAG
jgi:hypothetical protein